MSAERKTRQHGCGHVLDQPDYIGWLPVVRHAQGRIRAELLRGEEREAHGYHHH